MLCHYHDAAIRPRVDPLGVKGPREIALHALGVFDVPEALDRAKVAAIPRRNR
jgi:hypothetical protein